MPNCMELQIDFFTFSKKQFEKIWSQSLRILLYKGQESVQKFVGTLRMICDAIFLSCFKIESNSSWAKWGKNLGKNIAKNV